MFQNIYHKRKVLVTGHTGFKGSWLALWLSRMGARVTGYALEPPTNPSHYDLLREIGIHPISGDVRDLDKLKGVIRDEQPEIVFHLAAQAIVRLSYRDPLETFTSNVMGTINLLEASKASGTVRAIVNVTSDKCYENRAGSAAYREGDALGGYDPYSASKGCAELITNCWRNAYFNPKDYGRNHRILLASGRAGNVIGGGDWAADRLVPDIMRAVHQGERVKIRNPQAIRPWQHVLEPLSGYLLLGQKLLEGREEFAEAWNFGPSEEGEMTVGELVRQVKLLWPAIDDEVIQRADQPHEAGILRLDCAKARSKLNWLPVWTGREAIEKTASWYRAFYEADEILSRQQLERYVADAGQKHLPWAVQ